MSFLRRRQDSEPAGPTRTVRPKGCDLCDDGRIAVTNERGYPVLWACRCQAGVWRNERQGTRFVEMAIYQARRAEAEGSDK